MALYSLDGHSPRLADPSRTWIAPDATIIGKVVLGADVGVAVIENVTLGSVDERFRPTIENLSRNELSEIVEADDTFHVLYACEVDEGLGIPSRSAVEDRLYSRQLERIAQQYLRDVERKSTVDILLATPGAPNG